MTAALQCLRKRVETGVNLCSLFSGVSAIGHRRRIAVPTAVLQHLAARHEARRNPYGTAPAPPPDRAAFGFSLRPSEAARRTST
jgi:hypothetical protein